MAEQTQIVRIIVMIIVILSEHFIFAVKTVLILKLLQINGHMDKSDLN